MLINIIILYYYKIDPGYAALPSDLLFHAFILVGLH